MKLSKFLSTVLISLCAMGANALSVATIEHASLRNDLESLHDAPPHEYWLQH